MPVRGFKLINSINQELDLMNLDMFATTPSGLGVEITGDYLYVDQTFTKQNVSFKQQEIKLRIIFGNMNKKPYNTFYSFVDFLQYRPFKLLYYIPDIGEFTKDVDIKTIPKTEIDKATSLLYSEIVLSSESAYYRWVDILVPDNTIIDGTKKYYINENEIIEGYPTSDQLWLDCTNVALIGEDNVNVLDGYFQGSYDIFYNIIIEDSNFFNVFIDAMNSAYQDYNDTEDYLYDKTLVVPPIFIEGSPSYNYDYKYGSAYVSYISINNNSKVMNVYKTTDMYIEILADTNTGSLLNPIVELLDDKLNTIYKVSINLTIPIGYKLIIDSNKLNPEIYILNINDNAKTNIINYVDIKSDTYIMSLIGISFLRFGSPLDDSILPYLKTNVKIKIKEERSIV